MIVAKILRYAARSDVGKVRSKNDDSAYAGHYLAVVADGMGGHAGGNIASASTVLDLIHLDADTYTGDAGTALADEIQTANSLLSDLVRTSPQLAGMGTTVTALLLSEDTLHLAHIGDSRAYRLKDGVFEQITIDHTFVQRLIDEGRLRPEDVDTHPHKNVLMRVLGDVDASPELDLSSYDVDAGDRWMLCSDGLNAVVDNATIESIVRETAGLQECVDRLVELTLDRGSPDNVTVVVIEAAEKTVDEINTTALGIVAEDQPRRDEASRQLTPAGTQEEVTGATAASDADSPPADVSNSAQSDQERVPNDHLDTDVLREELRARPHLLVGSAATVASTGEIPTIARRTAQRRAATLLTHKSPDSAHDADDEPRRSGRWLYFVATALVALIIAGGLWFGYSWTQTRYYVAQYEGNVAIFNGVSQSLGPISLSSLQQKTGVEVEDLAAYAQQRLARTLPADDLEHAQRIVRALEFPLSEVPNKPCPSPSPTPTASGTEGTLQSPSAATTSASAATPSSDASPLPECGGQS